MTEREFESGQIRSGMDRLDVTALEVLRTALRTEVPLPLGLRARVEAKVLRSLRLHTVPGHARLAVGCGLFLLLGARPEVVVIGPLAVLLFAAVIAYVRFVGMLDGDDEGADEVTL
jgi:hypothetical protein